MPDKTIIRLTTNPDDFSVKPDELTANLFVSDLPIQHSHLYYADEDLGLYVGVWDTNDMIETGGPYSCEEFMWLIDGEATIKNNKTGVFEKAKSGEAFIIPKGYDCQWHQSGYLRKFFVIWENPNELNPNKTNHEGIIIPKIDTPLSAMVTAQPFQITTDSSIPQEHIDYKDITGKFLTGSWASKTFNSEMRPFPYHQFSYVLSGSITLTDSKDLPHIFKTGDAFFIPKDVVCSGQSDTEVRLLFAILRDSEISLSDLLTLKP